MTDIYTDLASEIVKKGRGGPGVSLEEQNVGCAKLTIVDVLNIKGASSVGKPIGKYVTVASDRLCANDPETNRELSRIIADQLRPMLPHLDSKRGALVLGLGNSAVTPDALGGKTVKSVYVSRHIIENLPDAVDERASNVAAIAPGVLGVTGIETGEVAAGLVDRLQPACVIAVDSLAAMSTKRLLNTVQLTDTGISPGSGLNNARRELTRRTLGVPVVAIGVPLVVSALAICMDENGDEPQGVNQERRDELAGLIVTPKEIDEAVGRAAGVIGMAINLAVHDGIEYDEFASLL